MSDTFIGKATPRRRRHLLALGALSLMSALLLLDLAVARWVIGSDDLYRGRILPPFGRVNGLTDERLGELLAGLEGAPSTHVFRAFDAELGWTNRPGSAGGFAFSSIGARGAREVAPEPAAGTRRIACYGDSFTYGSEVGDDETFCTQLEALEPDFEALNFGVAAYGTDQALLRFQRHGLHGADVLVIGLLLENIARNVNRYRSLYEPMETTPAVKPRFVLGSSGDLELVPVPFEDEAAFLRAVRDGSVLQRTAEHEYWAGERPLLASSAILRVVAARRAITRRRSERLWAQPESEPYRVTLAVLRRFAEEGRAAGAQRVVVLIFGTRLDLAWLEEHGGPYWGSLLADLEAAGIEFVDLPGRLLPVWREPGVYLEHHLGPVGNRIVAEELQALLARP